MKIYRARDITPALREELGSRLAAGQVGVMPTDTIYGLTADARNREAVERILAIKRRRTPVSVIPHSLEWARLLVEPSLRALFDQTVERFRGRYTMLWPACRQPKLAHPLVQTDELVGLRLPEHWILRLATEAGLPLTTTSVNRTGASPMHALSSLDPEIREEVDFLVYQGPLENPPSTLVRCDTPEFERKARG